MTYQDEIRTDSQIFADDNLDRTADSWIVRVNSPEVEVSHSFFNYDEARENVIYFHRHSLGDYLEIKNEKIQTGDKVRSYDSIYPERHSDEFNFVEGTVVGIREIDGLNYYMIDVERDVHLGQTIENGRQAIRVVVNGTETQFGETMNVVKKLN